MQGGARFACQIFDSGYDLGIRTGLLMHGFSEMGKMGVKAS
ncbi:hypothetical protein HMPREF9412_1082 [Paenibacillus sp. HGF5]|nr:hypothetical protein HMPREF9412_1082 [Paenibacillus sp. HGF5]